MMYAINAAIRIRRAFAILAAVAVGALFASAISAPAANAATFSYTTHVQAGAYRTLIKFWNVPTRTGTFRCPAGAKIRVRYGGDSWWNGYSTQGQTLDCASFKRLQVGGSATLVGARFQIKVPESSYVSWTYSFDGP